MSATITKSLKIDKAIQNIADLNNGYYYFAGKPTEWNDEANPDIAGNSNEEIRNAFNEIIFMKKMTPDDGIIAIPRFNWTAGVVYEKYVSSRSVKELYELTRQSKSIYCMNDANQVYICLSNNNGAESLTQPDGISITKFTTTEDGYVWKFLFDLTDNITTKFLNPHWIPVPYLSSQKTVNQDNVESSSIPGTIDSITINEGGSGYGESSTTAVIQGDGSIQAQATVTVSAGAVTNIVITNAGQGYSHATVSIVGDGENATATAEISPYDGHGADITTDLHANNLLFFGLFEGDENELFPTVNDYRQLGIIKNPTDDASEVLTLDGYNNTTILAVTGISSGPFLYDEIVNNSPTSSATGNVLARPESNIAGDVSLINVSGTFPNTGELKGAAAVGEITKVTEPTHKKYSGEIMYLENIKPITRNTSQTEFFRFVVEY